MSNKIEVAEIYHAIEGEGVLAGTPQIILRLMGCNRACVFCDEERTWKPGLITPTVYTSGEALVADCEAVLRPTVGHAALPRPQWVSLTGGEPLARPDETLTLLLGSLRRAGWKIAVHTNGTMFRPAAATMIDFWSITPTLSSSGHSALRDIGSGILERVIRDTSRRRLGNGGANMELKFVLDNEDDVLEADQLIARLAPFLDGIPIVVQPVWPKEQDGSAENPRAEWAPASVVRERFRELAKHPVVLAWPNVRLGVQTHKFIYGPGLPEE